VVNWAGREGLMRGTLNGLSARLDPAVFARAHRSTIVNLAKVKDAASLADGSWRLTLHSGAELVVSRTYRDAVLRRLRGDPNGT
jgi:DNA-binding LytR/AlgR family response regulator